MDWKDIERVNKELNTVPIKGKKYVMVKDKVLGLRAVLPNAGINTEILEYDGTSIIIKATIFDGDNQIGCGIAEEKINSSTINKTSFVENCETSAIGRALSSIGIGAEDSYASGEEVATAIMEQNVEKISVDNAKILQNMLEKIKEEDADFYPNLAEEFKITKLTEIKLRDYGSILLKVDAKMTELFGRA